MLFPRIPFQIKPISPRRMQILSSARLLCLFALLCLIATAQSAEDLASRAAQAMQSGDFADAEMLFLKLTVLTPKVAELYSNLGMARYYGQKPDEARKTFA